MGVLIHLKREKAVTINTKRNIIRTIVRMMINNMDSRVIFQNLRAFSLKRFSLLISKITVPPFV